MAELFQPIVPGNVQSFVGAEGRMKETADYSGAFAAANSFVNMADTTLVAMGKAKAKAQANASGASLLEDSVLGSDILSKGRELFGENFDSTNPDQLAKARDKQEKLIKDMALTNAIPEQLGRGLYTHTLQRQRLFQMPIEEQLPALKLLHEATGQYVPAEREDLASITEVNKKAAYANISKYAEEHFGIKFGNTEDFDAWRIKFPDKFEMAQRYAESDSNLRFGRNQGPDTYINVMRFEQDAIKMRSPEGIVAANKIKTDGTTLLIEEMYKLAPGGDLSKLDDDQKAYFQAKLEGHRHSIETETTALAGAGHGDEVSRYNQKYYLDQYKPATDLIDNTLKYVTDGKYKDTYERQTAMYKAQSALVNSRIIAENPEILTLTAESWQAVARAGGTAGLGMFDVLNGMDGLTRTLTNAYNTGKFASIDIFKKTQDSLDKTVTSLSPTLEKTAGVSRIYAQNLQVSAPLVPQMSPEDFGGLLERTYIGTRQEVGTEADKELGNTFRTSVPTLAKSFDSEMADMKNTHPEWILQNKNGFLTFVTPEGKDALLKPHKALTYFAKLRARYEKIDENVLLDEFADRYNNPDKYKE